MISKFFILSTCLTTLSSCVFVVDDTENGKDNYMEETMEVGDIMMYCSMPTSITNCCMTKRYQIIMDQSACMACLRRGQGRQSTCVCRREFRMNSRRRGSPPQCSGDLARKNSLSIIVNTFAKFLLNPLFSHNLGILAQVITT